MGRISRKIKELTARGIAPEKGEPVTPSVLSTPATEAPPHIAEKILSARSSLEGERKQVTVLFADVAGFTSLSENLDPEEVRDLIRPAIDIMASEVHIYEGTIAQFTGDGLMALFGAPLAHEDAPHRALYAALAMQARLAEYGEGLKSTGIELSIRVGINTGLVIVGSIGDDLTMEYTALGDTVNLASRMESAAEPGTVQISESTYRLVEGYFDFSDLGEIEVRGKEQPIHAYRVLGVLPAKGRVTASLTRGLSPFVGREKELDQLADRYLQSRQGKGQVVGMVGEPGVGKSRLLLQFREILPPEEYIYLEGGCIHYGEAIPYLPVLGILRDYFDIREGEDDTTSKQQMERRLSSLNGQLAHLLPPLQELLTLDVDDQIYLSLEPAQRRERIFEAIRYLFMAESQRSPLILAIEDLHWIDNTTEEFLAYFIEGMHGASILLLLLYRPEYSPTWASKTFYSQIRVDQLPDEPSVELVESILSEGEVSPELSGFIVSRTAGNPLFIEELTRGLLEAGSILKDNEHYVLSSTPSDIQVPETIQGIIASRLDRLSGDLKEILQVASVIGREFSLRLLQEVTGLGKVLKSYLMQLQSLEFIYEKNIFPEPDYVFRHALTQEVAYSSLLLKHRREIHARIGQAIERLYQDTLDDFYETLAYHYSRSEDTEKALHFLKLSGDKAVNYSLWEASHFYKEAILVLDTQSENEERNRKKLSLHLLASKAMMGLGYPEGSLETLQDAERLARELKDGKSLAAIYSDLGMYHTMKGSTALGMEYSEKSFCEAEKVGDVESMAEGAYGTCTNQFFTGDIPKIVDTSRRVLRLLEEQQREKDLYELGGSFTVYAGLSGWCGFALGCMGEFDEAGAVLDRALEHTVETDDAFGKAFVELTYFTGSYWSGDAERLMDHARRAIEVSEDRNIDIFLDQLWSYVGAAYYFLGEYEKARDHVVKAIKLNQESGLPVTQPWLLHDLSLILVALGELGNAEKNAEKALRLSLEYKTRVYEGLAWMGFGLVVGNADPARIDAASQDIRQGIAILDGFGLKPFSAEGYIFLGEVFEIAGRREDALENLKKAEGMLKDLEVDHNSYWITRAREALARLGQL